jgi:hypothetical protein
MTRPGPILSHAKRFALLGAAGSVSSPARLTRRERSRKRRSGPSLMRSEPSPRAAKRWRARTERGSCRAKSVSRMHSSRTDWAGRKQERSRQRPSPFTADNRASIQSEMPKPTFIAMSDRILCGCPFRTWLAGILAGEWLQSASWANDGFLCKSLNTFTLYCTVSHLLFWNDQEKGSNI